MRFTVMKQVLTGIISNTEVMSGHHLLCARAPDVAAEARPGQFVMVKCGDRLTLRRPLSIHRVANSSQLHLLFNVIGKGTLWLSQQQNGDKLDLLGPLGNSFSIEPNSRNLLLIAGGIGIAPLAFLAYHGLSQGKSVTLLLGARTATGLYPVEYLPNGVETVVTTEDGSSGKKGMVNAVFPDYIGWADQIYACGPLAMYQTMAAQMQRQKKRKPVQISLEVRMGCGLGACYSCSIKTRSGMKQVCRDGPVFDIEDVILQEVKT
jgi:dihydroorotate dehydrogenase electron transfer subunit